MEILDKAKELSDKSIEVRRLIETETVKLLNHEKPENKKLEDVHNKPNNYTSAATDTVISCLGDNSITRCYAYA